MIRNEHQYERSFEVLEGLYQGREELIALIAAKGIQNPKSTPHVQALQIQILEIEEELREYRRRQAYPLQGKLFFSLFLVGLAVNPYRLLPTLRGRRSALPTPAFSLRGARGYSPDLKRIRFSS